MAWQEGDIQFNDDALGIGRALRFQAQAGFDVDVSDDSGNPDIKIVTFSPGSETPIDRLVKTSSFEVGATGELQAPLYFIDASLGNIVITMPLTAGNDNKYRFIRIDGSSNTVNFVGKLGTELFGGDDGDPTLDMYEGEDFDMVTDYTNWFI